MLALCLLVFYGPMMLSARSVVTSGQGDPVAHMLTSLGDDRIGGRFFHYFDLSANTRLWGNDVRYNPLHLIRLISIALGSHHIGWGVLMATVHSCLFLALYAYSRRILLASTTDALTGAMVAFFATSWLEWTALVYWTAGAVLLVVSICEYWLFLTTARRRHLFMCILANTLQPYVTFSQALIPTQAYLLGAVLLMAFHRAGAWRSAISPLIRYVWPLTALGWVPILAPVVLSVGSGLTVREGQVIRPLTWGLDVAPLTQWLGLLFPVPSGTSDLCHKLGWLDTIEPPNSWLFGSFLFLPSLLALWQSGRRSLRLMVVGLALYCASVLIADCLLIPSALVRSLGFSRLFAFPALSGLVVAAGITLRAPSRSQSAGRSLLHGFYWVLLGSAVMGLVALLMVSADRLTDVGLRLGLIGSGTVLPGLLRSARVFAVGVALGLASYFFYDSMARRTWALNARGHSTLGSIALCLTIMAPALGFGYGEGWYERPPELDAMLSPPSEFQFLRERMPSYEYRVGIILSSEMQLAAGDWKGFWTRSSRREERVVFHMRENDLRLRQGLAFALSPLHFFAPVHTALRKDGNPFLQRPKSHEAPFLNHRHVILRPEAESLEDYGVRYWLSTFDLERRSPEKFARVYQGEYAAVFENQDAKPVAYLLKEPTAPLSLEHTSYGVAIALPAREGGKLSIHLDLRRMNARAVDPDGRTTSLTLEPAGRRWVVEVPPGNAAVVFTASESVLFKLLATGAGAAFLLLVAMLFVIRRSNEEIDE